MSPFDCAWYGDEKSCFACKGTHIISAIITDMNCIPRSLKISHGTPVHEKMLISASATSMEVIFLRMTASGYCIAKSTLVRMYLYHPLAAGTISPMLSMLTFAKCSSTVGTISRSTLLTCPFPTFCWQWVHVCMHWRMSFLKKKNLQTCFLVWWPPWCPAIMESWAKERIRCMSEHLSPFFKSIQWKANPFLLLYYFGWMYCCCCILILARMTEFHLLAGSDLIAPVLVEGRQL